MNRRTLFPSRTLCTLLALALLAGPLGTAASAQNRRRRPVVVSFGQPNIWSLEQAHYLLSRLHMQNLGLRAKELAEDELDPNAVNATRINILKSLLQIRGEFDQVMASQNPRILRTQQFNDSRRQDLITQRDGLQSQSTSLSRDVAQLQFEREQMNSDASATDAAKKLKDAEIAQKKGEQAAVDKQIGFDNDELKTLGAEPSGTPQSPALSGGVFDQTKLPTSILDNIVNKNVDDLLKAARDAKLDATTILDNHIQMQYEIIARQLTLLRDEVGPGERLVFLELPQSIYTTPGAGDEKMAQSWWHVNGYTRTDPFLRQLLDLYDIEKRWQDIQQVKAFSKKNLPEEMFKAPCGELNAQRIQGTQSASNSTVAGLYAVPEDQLSFGESISKMYVSFKCEHESARKRVLNNLFRQASDTFSRAEQRGARDNQQTVDAIRKVIGLHYANGDTRDTDRDGLLNPDETRGRIVTRRDGAAEDSERGRIEEVKRELLDLLSDGSPTLPSDEATQKKFTVENAMEFVSLGDHDTRGPGYNGDIALRTVRTVDIIPRQSSLNVSDIQETVKSTGIMAAFKFLFGFAGETSLQRQREQYEQFLHQELYASGFGKGSNNFGWTFGALPGTKRVAPGVRTTYAALVVPADAESLVVSARGCYFSRHNYQPLDYEEMANNHWDGGDNCGDEQTYIIPVPGGGDTSNFWVTNVDYQPAGRSGQAAVVSIRGNNFSSQMGVLVDGVPLYPVVGLAQPLLETVPKGVTENCAAGSVCGHLERIDPQQIVFSFTMPNDKDGNGYAGTPTITLIAPGKSVDLNGLDLTINGDPHSRLRGDEKKYHIAPSIFPGPDKPTDPPAKLTITEMHVFRVSPNSRLAFAVMRGKLFRDDTHVFVNGRELPPKELPPADETEPAAGERPRAQRHGKRPAKRAAQPAQPPRPSEYKEFRSDEFYRLFFELPPGDSVNVTALNVYDKDGKKVTEVATASDSNPLALKISGVTTISYDPGDGDTKPALIIRIEGTGFGDSTALRLDVDGASKESSRIVEASSGAAIVRLVDPERSVGVTLTNGETGSSAKTIVKRDDKP